MIFIENRIHQNGNEMFFIILTPKIRPSRMKQTKIAQKNEKIIKEIDEKIQTRLNQETIK